MNALTAEAKAVAAEIEVVLSPLPVAWTPPANIVPPCVIVGPAPGMTWRKAAYQSWRIPHVVAVFEQAEAGDRGVERLDAALTALLVAFDYAEDPTPAAAVQYGKHSYLSCSVTLPRDVCFSDGGGLEAGPFADAFDQEFAPGDFG